MLGTHAGTKVNVCRHLVKPTEVWTERTQKKNPSLVLIDLPIVQLSDTGEWPNPKFPHHLVKTSWSRLKMEGSAEG